MLKKITLSLLLLVATQSATANDEFHTWYAGTEFVGKVTTFGLVWNCSGGTCTLSGPYGTGLNMKVCKELSRKIGRLQYYYNDAGMTWSQSENGSLLDQCNSY